jgi:hypothetical protein
MKKVNKNYVGFDPNETGMDNRGEYLRTPLEPAQEEEKVDHPKHYNKGIEVIDFIESWNFDFATGNIIKYIVRHKLKNDPIGDLKKARWYIDRLIETYEVQEK